jgi:hypothetical protein
VKRSVVKRKNVKNGGNSEKRKIDDSESDEEMDGEEEETTGLFDRVRVIEGGVWVYITSDCSFC